MPVDDNTDLELTIAVTIGEMNIRATINTGWRTSGISKEIWKKVKTPLVPYPEEKGPLLTLDGTVLNPIGLTSFLVHFPSSAGWVHEAIVYEEGRPCMLGLDVVTAVGLSINVRRGEYYVDPPSSNQRAAYLELLKQPLTCIGSKGTNNNTGTTAPSTQPVLPTPPTTERPHRNSKQETSNTSYRSVKQEPTSSSSYRPVMPPATVPSESQVRGNSRRCYTCGNWGHLSPECPMTPNRCHLCHRRGHQRKDCPGNMSPSKNDHHSNSPRNRYKEIRHI